MANFFYTALNYSYLYAQAAWLRCHNGAAFASLKKYPLEADFFNHAFGMTEPKEAPYVTTGNNLNFQALITLKLKLVLYLKRLKRKHPAKYI
jgi:hypothetical protein